MHVTDGSGDVPLMAAYNLGCTCRLEASSRVLSVKRLLYYYYGEYRNLA